jgi:hypothetical protein
LHPTANTIAKERRGIVSFISGFFENGLNR